MLVGLLLLAVCIGLSYALWHIRSHERETKNESRPLPGPSGLPFVGAIHKLSAQNPWMSFHKWSEQYGPVYQVNLAGSNHVWISSEEVAHELLSKKGAIYSDRPHIPALLLDNRTSGCYLPLMSVNELWHRQRRFAKHIMTTSHNASFYFYPELEAKRLMFELLKGPSEYNKHLESFVSRVTCRLAWGTAEASDELKQRARELLVGVSPTGALGNKLPAVMSLPEKLVPAKAWEVRRMNTEKMFFGTMLEKVRCEAEQNIAPPSWMKMFLDMKQRWGFKDDLEGSYAVGMHGIAGALTIAAPMQGWCLAMCLYPRVLLKLQQEIDQVCGPSPPTLANWAALPYLRATIRETMRWRPPVPTGIPHLLTQDDSWNGFHIPAGSVMHPLEWSMARDAAKYPDPEVYNPDRWIDPQFPTYKEPLTKFPTICYYSQFGFGRRVCQGQEVAEADLFVGIGAVAWAFDVKKAKDASTQLDIPVPEMDYSELLIAKPRWFRFEMAARSEQKKREILALFEEEEAKGTWRPSKQYWDDKNPKLGWGNV